MVTVPTNELISRTIKPLKGVPRTPAILESFDLWATWPGEEGAAKAPLKTMEGVNWTSAPEPKKPRPRKG